MIDPEGAIPTTVRVPRYYLRALKRLNRLIVQQGVLHLPPQLRDVLQSTKCPLCDKEMHRENGYLVCKCGLAKPINPADAVNTSDLVGFAVIAFATLARTVATAAAPKTAPLEPAQNGADRSSGNNEKKSDGT